MAIKIGTVPSDAERRTRLVVVPAEPLPRARATVARVALDVVAYVFLLAVLFVMCDALLTSIYRSFAVSFV